MHLIYVDENALGDMILQLHIGDSLRGYEVQKTTPEDRYDLTTIMGPVGETVTHLLDSTSQVTLSSVERLPRYRPYPIRTKVLSSSACRRRTSWSSGSSARRPLPSPATSVPCAALVSSSFRTTPTG
jgi:hypothetical protein